MAGSARVDWVPGSRPGGWTIALGLVILGTQALAAVVLLLLLGGSAFDGWNAIAGLAVEGVVVLSSLLAFLWLAPAPVNLGFAEEGVIVEPGRRVASSWLTARGYRWGEVALMGRRMVVRPAGPRRIRSVALNPAQITRLRTELDARLRAD